MPYKAKDKKSLNLFSEIFSSGRWYIKFLNGNYLSLNLMNEFLWGVIESIFLVYLCV